MDNFKEFLVMATYAGIVIVTSYLAIELLNSAVGVSI